MRKHVSDLFGILLPIAGAIVLWRAAMMLSSIAPFPFAHGERLTFALIVAGGVVGFTAVMARLQSRRVPFAPLNRVAVVQTCFGFAAYAGVALVAVGALLATGLVDITFTNSPDAALGVAYLVLLVLLSEALPEELLFRGWLMQVFEARRSPWTPVLGQTAIFTLFAWAVGAVASLNDASFIACFGLALGIVRAVTGTVWASVGLHLAFITAQQSALPHWAIWTGDPHMLVQAAGLTIVPFSVIIAVLFGRVRRRSSLPSPV